MTKVKRIAMTINLAVFPLHFFFSFLYYTDPLSTLLHLLMHFLWIRKCYKWSAVAGTLNTIRNGLLYKFYEFRLGLCAVITRQTAIVWIFFHGVLTITSILNKSCRGPTTLSYYAKKAKYCAAEIFRNSFGYAIIGVIFAVFVYVNDGIVLGDRSNHQVTLNAPQFLYFTLFTGLCCLPHLISQFSQLISFFKCHKTLTVSISLVYTTIVYFNTVGHWYNLNDAHHFTHYFITAVHDNRFFALSLVPIYTICTVFIVDNLFRALDKCTAFVFLFVVVMNLIFQLLFEMRYFIVPFLLFRFTVQTRKWSVLAAEFCLFFTVNVITISLYIARPRFFPDDINDFQLLMYWWKGRTDLISFLKFPLLNKKLP